MKKTLSSKGELEGGGGLPSRKSIGSVAEIFAGRHRGTKKRQKCLGI